MKTMCFGRFRTPSQWPLRVRNFNKQKEIRTSTNERNAQIADRNLEYHFIAGYGIGILTIIRAHRCHKPITFPCLPWTSHV